MACLACRSSCCEDVPNHKTKKISYVCIQTQGSDTGSRYDNFCPPKSSYEGEGVGGNIMKSAIMKYAKLFRAIWFNGEVNR